MKSKRPRLNQKLYRPSHNRGDKRSFCFVSMAMGLFLAFINIQAQAAAPDSLGVRTIIIDPGHGGKDPGCLGAFSHEADVALAISLRLGEMIKEKYGNSVKIVYTRTKDDFVELHDRAKIANKHKGDLFICIHANSGASHAHGSEVYALGLHKTDAQLHVAERENSSILMEDNHETKYQGFDPKDPDSYIILSHLASSYLTNSLNFAGKIQKYFQKVPELSDRGVKQAGFLVLHQVNMASVLIETGFLTNKDEEKVLNDKESQKNIAGAIFNAFVDYKTEMENINGIITNKKTNENKVKEEPKGEKEVVKEDSKDKEPNKNTYSETTNNTESEKDNKIYFTVQITASTKSIANKPANFKGLDNISEHPGKGIYRYTYGKSDNFEGAKKLHALAREKGYTDAFIVAYQNGERIDVNKAIGMAKQ